MWTTTPNKALKPCIGGLFAVVAVCAMTSAAVASPTVLNVQGALRTTGGGPVADGTYGVAVTIWDAAKDGTALYTDKFIGVPVQGGGFGLSIGGGAGAKVLDDSLFTGGADRWIELQIGADPPLPRHRIDPVPFALHARTAATAAQAEHAKSADSAKQADSAKNADNAKNADSAKNADNAKNAEVAKTALTAQKAAAADQAATADVASKLDCTGCIELKHIKPGTSFSVDMPNIWAVTDLLGKPAGLIKPGVPVLVAGNHFGAKPELLVWETPLQPTGPAANTSIKSEFPPSAARAGLIALAVRNPTTKLRSNTVLLPFSPETTYGTGVDGSVKVNGTVKLDAATLAAGRKQPDAVRYSVAKIGSNSVTTTKAADGIDANDEVLIINLRGSGTNVDAVGRYEIRRVSAVAGAVITFYNKVEQVYGQTANSDLSGQVVVMQRVPQYTDLDIAGTLTTSAFDGTGGGVLALRVSGTLSGTGTLSVAGLGYRGGAHGQADNAPGIGGEGIVGTGKTATASGKQANHPLSNGGAGGHGASFGGCGAGGGGHTSKGESGAAGSSYTPGDYDTLGGDAVGDKDLSKRAYFGGAGGGGGDNDNQATLGTGGNGGGIMLLWARTITGLKANAQGAKGLAGDGGNGGCGYAIGGSGAGGSIRIVADGVTLTDVDATGSPRIKNGSDCTNDGTFRPYGGAGSDGRVHVTAKQLKGTSKPAANAD